MAESSRDDDCVCFFLSSGSSNPNAEVCSGVSRAHAGHVTQGGPRRGCLQEGQSEVADAASEAKLDAAACRTLLANLGRNPGLRQLLVSGETGGLVRWWSTDDFIQPGTFRGEAGTFAGTGLSGS